uniref:cadherin-like domain-containing protein n=1 Tax=Azospirillum sp. TaxID=34012 RepID=UPI0026151715
DTLSVTGFTQTGGRAVSVTRTGGALTLDPAQFNDLAVGQSAVLTFAYGVTDGAATTAQTLNVTVQGRNDAPVAQNDQFTVWKNTPKQLTAGMLLANDTDVDGGNALSITSVSGAVKGTVTLDSQGHVLFTPTVGATGAASFKYTVNDGNGGAAEGSVSLSIQDAASATDNPLSVATLYNQYDPTAITLTNGNTLAVWWSYNGNDQKVHAMARRFDPSGNLIDTNADLDLGVVIMPYDTYFLPMIGHLRATALSGGGFVLEYLGKAGATTRVSLQRYDDNGTKLNGAGGTTNPLPIQVNTDTWSYVVMPRVAVLQDGRYMAIWEAHDAGNQGDIVAQVFNPNGTVSSGQFRVNTTTLWHQMYPEVTTLTDGGFVVTWNSGKADTGNVVAFQRFNANGLLVGGETRVSEQSGTQEWPTISALPDGGWVTVWQRAALGSSDYSVQGQIFNADGSRRGSAFTVNQLDAGAQGMPRVSVMADGGFVVSWNSQAPARDVGADQWARRFDRQGNALTDEFRINATTTGDQTLSSLAPLSDGRFLAFYTNPDSSYEGVSWRLFGPRPAVAGTLEGTGGTDLLIGTDAADEIIAYGGNDVLLGKAGPDILTGGAGADSFRFAGLTDGLDTITDFQPGQDRIEVVGTAFGGLPLGQLAAGRFALNTPADADDRFVFNTTTGALSYDPDGNGAMAATTIALLNVRTLAASDIWVVAPS